MTELEDKQPKPTALPYDNDMKAVALAPLAIEAAKAFGFVGNQAVLSANKAVMAFTNINLLEAMGNTHLIADKKALTFTPTELGAQLIPPASAKAVNILLERAGLQLKNHKQWLPTDTGLAHCEVLDTGKKHASGVPVKQVKWFSSVIELI